MEKEPIGTGLIWLLVSFDFKFKIWLNLIKFKIWLYRKSLISRTKGQSYKNNYTNAKILELAKLQN